VFETFLKNKGLNKDKLSEIELYKELSEYSGLLFIDNLEPNLLDVPYIKSKFNEKLIKQYIFIPLYEDKKKIRVAVSNINTYELLNILKNNYNREIEFVLAPESKLKSLISFLFDKQEVVEEINQIKSANTQRTKTVEVGKDLEDEKVVKKFLSDVFLEAIHSRVSDIHINPEREFVYFRFRIDGKVLDYEKVSINALTAIMTTLKLFCKLDISEKRKPQDGQFTISLENGDEINIRVAIINTIYGEKATLRILNADKSMSTISEMNIGKYTREKLEILMNKKKGIVLVTGATGSGKSTTLKAVLNTVNTGDITIITIEDPVENKIPNIIQTEVNVKAGVTFASGLRSILRLDPDIIMIGEIRDEETAEIAVRAAITGHMVYATLHTNSALNTIARLKDMNVEPYLLADSLEGVINQMLVRRVCPACKVKKKLPADSIYRKIFNIPEDEEFYYYEGEGCPQCRQTGYSGRVLISEALLVTEDIKKLIASGKDIEAYPDILAKQNFKTLKDDALLRVRDGLTDFKEVMYIQ